MPNVRLDPSTSALLLQDMQNDLVKSDSRTVEPISGSVLIANCQKLLAKARDVGMTVIHVRVSRRLDMKDAPRLPLGSPPDAAGPRMLIEGTPGAQIVDELAPRPRRACRHQAYHEPISYHRHRRVPASLWHFHADSDRLFHHWGG